METNQLPRERVFILNGVRTPIGSFRGSLNQLSSTDLGVLVSKEVIKRSSVDPISIEEVYVGSVLTANCGQNIARQISIGSGLPETTQAVSINKVCSSSMKALSFATMAIRAGSYKVALVVGTESMSNAPFYVERCNLPYGGFTGFDGIVKDGLTDAILQKPMGICAEKTVKEFAISRAQQDAYAINSYKKAETAWKEGLFSNEVMPVAIKQRRGPDVVVDQDEEFKKLIEDKVATLAPAFLKDGTGTITAANASSINDGAVAAVIASSCMIPEGMLPMAEIVDFAEHGVEPMDFTVAPIGAVRKLLEKNNLKKEDIALWEINEAFSVTALAFISELDISPSIVNVKGGAVALGHPLGMSGLRIVLSLANSLTAGQLGIAAICNGGGEGMAVFIKKL